MRESKYSDELLSQVKDFRDAGLPWEQIAQKIEIPLGRKMEAFQARFYKVYKPGRKKLGRPFGTKKRKVQRDYVPLAAAPVPPTKKPLIALVGDQTEIVASLKELFS